MRHEILTRISTGAALLLTLVLPSGCGTSAEQRPGANTPKATTSAVAPATAETLPRPLPDDPMAVTIHRLDNGLTVYISTDREQPRISTWIGVRAGSRHDPAHSTGLAHYLEHMLFKGTEKLGTTDAAAERPHLQRIQALYRQLHGERDPARRQQLLGDIDRETQASARFVIPNELERLYTKLGATGLNAFTSPDATAYKVNLPSNRLAHWAAIEAERLARPTFRLFLHELEAVYEEKNRTLDSPERRGTEALLAMAWPEHPYGAQPNIGTAEHLRNPAFQDMIDYFQRWYVPNNMAIVLAGDIDAETALPVLREHFGKWTARPLPPVNPGRLPPMTGRQFREIRAETSEAVILSWQVPGPDHPDLPALSFMSSVIGHGTAGLLQTELVLTHKVTGAGSMLMANREAGLWFVSGSAKDGQPLAEVERMLLDTVEKLKQGQFRDEDLAAIALDEENGQKLELESADARAGKMLDAFVSGLPWAEVVRRERNRRNITRQDVIRVARKYLGPGMAVLHRRKGKFDPPKLASPRVTPLEGTASGPTEFARAIQALPVRPIEPVWPEPGRHYHRLRLPAGKLLAVRNERNDLTHVRYQFDVGQRRLPLLCYALELQALSGAGDLDAAAFRRKLFVLGANVETWCGADESGVSVAVVDEHLPAALELMQLWFRQPRFSAADLEGLLATTLTTRKRNVEDPRFAGAALAEFASRGPHSTSLAVPSNRQLAAATPAQLRALLAAYPDQQHETLYFGPRAPEAAARAIGFGRNHRPLARRPAHRYRAGNQATVYFLDRDTAQTSLDLAFTDGPIRRPDHGTAIVLSEYLGGGLGGAVMHELRETTGLVYAASAWYQWGDRAGDAAALLADAQTQPPKLSQAIDRLLALLRNASIDEGRLAEVKAKLEEDIRATRPRPRRLVTLVDSWDEYGHTRDPRPRLRAEFAAMTPQRLQLFWKRAARRPLRAAITGKGKELDRAQLSKLGKLEEKTAEQLFGYGPFPSGAQARAGK